MRIILGLLLALPLVAQVTAFSPSSATFYYMRGRAFPYDSTIAPVPQTINVTATGSWGAATYGGALATACDGTTPVMRPAVGSITGSGNGSFSLSFDCFQTLTPGTRTGTLTMNGVVLNITLVTMPADWPYSFVGATTGCTTPGNTIYPYPANCFDATRDRTGSSLIDPPQAIGSTFTDYNFGWTITKISDRTYGHEYSSIFVDNADSTLWFLTDGVNHKFVDNVGAIQYTVSAGEFGVSSAVWDNNDPLKLWIISGSTIKTKTLGVGGLTTVADYTGTQGALPSMTNITFGGSTGDITPDGWLAFSSGTTVVCVVDTKGLTTANRDTKTVCNQTVSQSSIDWVAPSTLDGAGNRYVFLVGNSTREIYRLAAGGSTLDRIYQTNSAVLGDWGHADIGKLGNEVFGYTSILANGGGSGVTVAATKAAINTGAQILVNTTAGGGAAFTHMLGGDTGQPGNDNHFSANWLGQTALDSTQVGPSSNVWNTYRISSLGSTNPCQITWVNAPGFANGSQIVIGHHGGTPDIHGSWVYTSTGATTGTIPISCIGNTYSNASDDVAAYGTQDIPLVTAFNQQEIQHVDHRTMEVRRAKHRSMQYGSPGLDPYRANPFASVSRNGRYVAFRSNYQWPERVSEYLVDFGPATERMGLAADPADTSMVIRAALPVASGSVSILVSTSPDLSSPVVSTTVSSSGKSVEYIATGLTAGTLYWVRVNSGGYANTVQARTVPALSGSAPVRLVKGGGGTINYGATSGLGSSCTSPCSITATKGLLYTDLSGSAAAMVVR